MRVHKSLLLLIGFCFFFFIGVAVSNFIYADPPDIIPPDPNKCEGANCIPTCGTPSCNPCYANPDCRGGGGESITCSGCQSVYSWLDTFGTLHYYCVDNNQLCASNQTCSNAICINSAPTCSGCQAWTGTACADNNAYCSGGLICKSGACVLPSPTPTPGNLACNTVCTGADQCQTNYCIGGVCRNSSCVNDTDCLCATPTPTPTPVIATPTPYKYSCNNGQDSRGGCVTSNDCVTGLTCIGNVCQNAACPGDSDCICGAISTPTNTATPTITPTPTNPTIPAGYSVVATVLACNSIKLDWSDGTTALGSTVTSYTPEMSVNGGAWSSQTSVSGSTFTSTISGLSPFNSYSYRIRATGARGSTYTQNIATVNTPACPTPTNTPTPTTGLPGNCTVDLTSSPQALFNPGQINLYWTSTGAVGTCATSGGWSGNVIPNDFLQTGIINSTTTFTITCHDSNNLSCSDSLTLNVGSLTCNQSTCTGSNQCGGTSNTCVVGVCRNSACISDTDCNCIASPTPTAIAGGVCAVLLQANPSFIPVGGSSILTWTSNANTASGTCVASGAWSGTKTNNGSQSTGPLTFNSAFSITCQNSSGQTCSDTKTVTVGATPTPIVGVESCNQMCRGDAECSSNFCYLGVCRTAACPTDGDCICGGSPTPTATLTPTAGPVNRSISGTVYFDTNNNLCASGTTGYGNAQIQVRNDGDSSIVGTQTTGATGSYAPISSSTTSNGHILIGNIASYTVRGVRDVSQGTNFTINYANGLGYGFDWTTDPNKTVDFCIGTSLQERWFQAFLGDVRYSLIDNPVPDLRLASPTNGNLPAGSPPANFFSSLGTSTIPSGKVSATNWQVNREYSNFNAVTVRSLGSTSYSFYQNQIQKVGITPQTLTSPLPSRIGSSSNYEYYVVNGDLLINQSVLVFNSSKIILLVNGRVTIQASITVPTTSLFIIAAKDNIVINSSVGQASQVDDIPANAALQGIFTSEKSIQILSNAACPTTEDLRLNVWGSLIANSLRPFSSNGSGQVVNQRTLCANNRNNPSLAVFGRPAFINLLNDTLKSTSRRWSE